MPRLYYLPNIPRRNSENCPAHKNPNSGGVVFLLPDKSVLLAGGLVLPFYFGLFFGRVFFEKKVYVNHFILTRLIFLIIFLINLGWLCCSCHLSPNYYHSNLALFSFFYPFFFSSLISSLFGFF